MSVRDTLQIGDPRLKAENQKIVNFNDPQLHQTIKDLIDTIHENKLIGMAAQQIGENIKAFITEPRQTKYRAIDQADILRVYINPTITWASEEKNVIFEGCGSVLHGQLFGPVERPKIIKIEYFDEKGKPHWLKCDGILARVIQHEYDHLQGIEFTEKITDYKQLMVLDFYQQNIRNRPDQIEAGKITINESDILE